jgi:uncharacterized protein YycO
MKNQFFEMIIYFFLVAIKEAAMVEHFDGGVVLIGGADKIYERWKDFVRLTSVNAERFRGIFSDTFVQLHFLLN